MDIGGVVLLMTEGNALLIKQQIYNEISHKVGAATYTHLYWYVIASEFNSRGNLIKFYQN